MPSLRIPVSTYRIQFNLGFRYVDGRDLVPYLNDLGITDLYSSPRFKARRGSPHAYDVANPLKINSELGTEDEFLELTSKLHAYGMGLVLDIVPNHMATSSENPWWMDLLENGRCSIYANHFAVDWGRPTAKFWGRPRILLPILGDLYGRVLENGEILLKIDENGMYAKYYETRLPLNPRSYRFVFECCLADPRVAQDGELRSAVEQLRRISEDLPEDTQDAARCHARHAAKEELKADTWRLANSSPDFRAVLEACLLSAGPGGGQAGIDLLDRILEDQHYRPAFWRMAAEELNYRRFFDINDLIGIRVEDPVVFDARHPEITNLVRNGAVTGLRIDHIDGLWDPAGYLARLRSSAIGREQSAEEQTGCSGFYVVVEKILGSDEPLPRDWQACGTTGYDFLNRLNGVFVNPEGLAKLDAFYRKFTGVELTMADLQYQRKKQVMELLFPGEVRALAYHLGRVAAMDRLARDLDYNDLKQALIEVIAWFPVYRSYTRSFEVSERDRRFVEQALDSARKALPQMNPEVFAFLRRVLLVEIPHYVDARDYWLGLVMGWQQFTGPCMAKGFEDTTCYNYYRLISQNEVGSDPELAAHPGGAEAFHKRNCERLAQWPYSMNATSTHDTKRSEDVRARINVLAEIPELWARRVQKWASWNEKHKTGVNGAAAPDRNDEYMLYQTLVGAWPLCDVDLASLRDRIRNFAQKAVREGKTHSNWLTPNTAYEEAFLAFIDAILADGDNVFLKDFVAFHRKIASAGAVNALAQVLLKICAPGVPDFYQGTEVWDLSLVDPDNRRPVDFVKRTSFLDDMRRREVRNLPALARELVAKWEDGRIKLWVTHKALTFRRAHPELFLNGEYLPVTGAAHACAFARRREGEWALAVAPRMVYCVDEPRRKLLRPAVFGNEQLRFPDGAPRNWRNVFTGEAVNAEDSPRLADLLAAFPVALLEPA